MRVFLMTSTAVLACMAPAAAFAQSQPSTAPASTNQDSPVPTGVGTSNAQTSGATATSEQASGATAQTDTSGLQDIIVTAQRRTESAQRAAIAINVVGGSQLVASGVTSSNTLSRLVPALTIQQIGASNTSFIRGVGNFSVSVTNDPAVAFNYDGVYIGRLTATSGTFFDLDRIEVLKGPQGTLYGRNATAGVINILPSQPKLGEFSGYGTVSFGNYNALVTEGAVNVAVGDDAAFRLSGTVTHRDGYLKDGTSDDKTQAARLQFKAKPLPGLTIRLAGDYTHLGGNGAGFSYVDFTNPLTGAVVPVNVPVSDGFRTPAAQAFYESLGAGSTGTVGAARLPRAPFQPIGQNSYFYGTNAEVDYDTGAGVLTVLPAARWEDIDNVNPAGGFPIANRERDHQYSIETRFAGKFSIFDYTAGFYYFDERVDLHEGSLTFGSSPSFFEPTIQHTHSYAPFGRLTVNLTPRLRLVGGIRYTHDHKTLDSQRIVLSLACTTAATCVLPVAAINPGQEPFPIPTRSGQTVAGPPGETISRTDFFFNGNVTYPKTTWRGAVEYDLTPTSLLYGSAETGFRSGGFNTAVGFETYRPETITAYTLGSKNRFLNNRVQLNLEAFYWRYSNQQIAHAAFDNAFQANSITQNIGKSRMKGVEAEVRVLATRHTVLSADVEYLDAKEKNFTFSGSALLLGRVGCPETAPVGPLRLVTVNCSGKPAYAAPKWSMNLGAEQTIPLGSYKLVGGVDTQFKTKRYLGFEYLPEELQGKSWTTNVQLSFGPANDKWSISAFVRNLENDRLIVAPFSFAGVVVDYTSPPRTFGARGTVKF